nr:MAG TPA: hypothetical protein [Caudoviricetes sp.]
MRALSRIIGALPLPSGIPLRRPYSPDVLSCRLSTFRKRLNQVP